MTKCAVCGRHPFNGEYFEGEPVCGNCVTEAAVAVAGCPPGCVGTQCDGRCFVEDSPAVLDELRERIRAHRREEASRLQGALL